MIYILHRIGYTNWDEVRCLVVRAVNPESARLIASHHHADEGAHVWTDPTHTTCEVLRVQGDPGLILRDFKAG